MHSRVTPSGNFLVRWLRFIGEPETRVLWRRLRTVFVAGLVTWALAGVAFWAIEPTVANWFEGMWLAFTTGATVGYGDFVPTTPAARWFAVLMVLLGMAFLSVATASIAALLVGESERRIERELLTEIRTLRHEVALLRTEMSDGRQPDAGPRPQRG